MTGGTFIPHQFCELIGSVSEIGPHLVHGERAELLALVWDEDLHDSNRRGDTRHPLDCGALATDESRAG